jgi:alpha-beta hydrolase superfamily lysophospholipase
VREEFARNPPRFPILITQGADDAVCPVDVVRRVLREANAPAATYVEFPGLLHEPFADTGKDEVFATVTDWLAASLEATAQEGPPCG